MTKDEALELALEALEEVVKWYQARDKDDKPMPPHNQNPEIKQAIETITAMKELFAQPEQEPVAIRYDFDGYGYQYIDSGSGSDWQTRVQGEPLYTHPVKDLEDIVINITWNENSMRDFGKDELNFARAIEAKLKDKNS